ncbi:hypothetical protein BECAL_02758 [Bellilinea caldifistulae]|uniref:Uncharacterized protein n=1 Tax=Bellilinea caldifistulae TaxID=360411 RepID=A0A0N8GM61_9CHLR|nr:hypothetical protein [Bellilinea caldifistulae]KPL74402.1 hypothetical protein AC812_11225 [Bellilinea caldifistulae]GAP11569.1 hypothetical protein BECAL_02758 [Bellilinea caldifistulae]
MTKWLRNLVWIGACIGIAACSTAAPSLPTAVIQPPLVSPTPAVELRQVETLAPPSTEAIRSTPTSSPAPPKTTHEDWFYPSPDGQWTVQVSTIFPVAADGRVSGETYRLSLSVFRKDGGLRWPILDEERPFGLGYTLPAQFHWSQDGSQFFYTEHGIPDGSPTIVGFDCGLYRVNLQNGERTQLTGECGLLRAAGDVETFAVLQGGRLVIHSLSGEVLREIAFTNLLQLDQGDNWQAGGLVWAPDNSRLAFGILGNIQQPAEMQTSFVLVDLISGVVRYIVENRQGQYLPVSWDEGETLLIQDQFGLRYRLNIRTAEISLSD